MNKNLPYSTLFEALKEFSHSVTEKFTARTPGQPEAQLKGPEVPKARGQQIEIGEEE